MSVYHERQQRSDSCRMHAINACLGGPVYTWQTFMQLCDRFDGVAGVVPGTCRTEYTAGTDVTLFTYALAQAGRTWKTLPLAMYRAGSLDNKKTGPRLEEAKRMALGAFVFNRGHVWYMSNRGGGNWVKVDSLSGGPVPSRLESVWQDGLGVEVVYPDDWQGDGLSTPDAQAPEFALRVAALSTNPGVPSGPVPTVHVSPPMRFARQVPVPHPVHVRHQLPRQPPRPAPILRPSPAVSHTLNAFSRGLGVQRNGLGFYRRV